MYVADVEKRSILAGLSMYSIDWKLSVSHINLYCLYFIQYVIIIDDVATSDPMVVKLNRVESTNGRHK